MSDDVTEVLGAITGRRIPGGCDDCTAYQTVQQHTPGVFVLTVHHDDTCPAYRQHLNRTERRRRTP